MKFIQGNVISSKYTVNEYVHNVPRQNLKTIQEYLRNAHKQNLKSIYHYNKDLVIHSIHVQVIYSTYHKGPRDTEKVKGHLIYIYIYIYVICEHTIMKIRHCLLKTQYNTVSICNSKIIP